ncbi:hypothetical protein HY404_01390 [Candidatus Microgenomates bacterium]|nr:hypothetical protein [Candidatus Microgenomates bacterium]
MSYFLKTINFIFVLMISSLLFLFTFHHKAQAAFSISNVPASVADNESFSVTISLTISNSAGNNYYLRAALAHPDAPSSYFGYTKNNAGSWYNGKPSPLDYTQFYQITMNSDNSWSGTIEVKPDAESSYYKGEASYTLKVGRYTQAGSGPTWADNSTTLNITVSATPTPTPHRFSYTHSNSDTHCYSNFHTYPFSFLHQNSQSYSHQITNSKSN